MSGRTLILVAVLVGSLCQGGPGAATEPTRPEFHPDWIVVRLKAPLVDLRPDGSFALATGSVGLDAAILEQGVERIEHALSVSMRAPRNPEALARHGLDRIYKFHIPAGADVRATIARFARLPEVETAEPDYVNRLTATVPNDPLFVGQWAYDQVSDADVDGPEAWDISRGRFVVLAILDTGIESSHAEFAGKIVPGWDFVNNDSDPQDDYDHGTRTAGVAAANTNNATGIAGTCWRCRIMPLKVFGADGQGLDTWFADAMTFAADNGASVVNYSAVGPNSTLKVTGIQYAYDAGVIFVGSAGNEVVLVQFPARYLEANAVGASNNLDAKSDFSGAGDWLDVHAPGEQVLVLNNDGTYTNRSGTSYSAPLVVGLFGLVKSVHDSVGREEARQLVIAGAVDQVGGDLPGWDMEFGWGRANMHRTLLGTQSVTSLRVEGRSSTRLYYDTANPLADSYDFIRGDLDALTETGAGVELGNVVCLENDSPDPDTVGDEDTGIPAVGEGYFYLGRFNAGPWPGSYGGSSRNRDRMTPDPAFAADWFVTRTELTSELGFAVDTAGDVNNDGYDDVIVGALSFPAAAGTGAAFVYHGSAAGLSTTAAWSIESDEIESWLGHSVAGAGDINGDGYDDVLVGEPRYDGAVDENEGRVLVYLGSASGTQTTVHRILSDPQDRAWFGFNARTAGDVNNDGYDDVIVAAQRYDNGQNNEGRAYLYLGSNLGLSAVPAWTFEPNQANARLRAVGTAGDVNNDGYDDVIVGAPWYDGVDVNEGRAWLFLGSSGGLSTTPDTTLTVGGTESRLGYGAISAGDVDNDGYDDVVVTARWYSNGEFEEGAAFLFMGSGSGLASTPAWSFETDQTEAQVHGAEGAGDLNNDGYDDVIVGSGHYGHTRLHEGRAFVFLGSGSGLSATPVWSDPGWTIDARFGWRVATAGNVNGDDYDDVIVGAKGYTNGGFSEGAALVYHGSASPLNEAQPADCDVPTP